MLQNSFSIVVVCLNPGEKLTETVNSILSQQYGNYEIIIKDGGSADGSLEKLPADSRIRLLTCKDSGIYDAMNQALPMITGQYVLFLNCGDLFYNDTVLFDMAKVIENKKNADREQSAGYKEKQDVALSLALCELHLAGRGAYRVHGGGFAGTVQAFVPLDILDSFRAGIDAVLGEGACHVLSIRPEGGVEAVK